MTLLPPPVIVGNFLPCYSQTANASYPV